MDGEGDIEGPLGYRQQLSVVDDDIQRGIANIDSVLVEEELATHYTPHHPTVDEWFCERLSEDENLLLISLSLASPGHTLHTPPPHSG
jgi:hypothetical protein